MPSRPSVAATMRREILDASALAGGGEGLFDPVSSRGVVLVIAQALVRLTVWSAKYFAFTVREIGECSTDTGMQGYAALLAVLCSGEGHVAACQINVIPIKPQCFADPRAGIEQEDDQHAQMFLACSNEALGLFGGNPNDSAPRLLRSFHDDTRTQATLGGMLQHRRSGCIKLSIPGGIGCTGINFACTHIDSVLIDFIEWRRAEKPEDLVEKAFVTTVL